jgi:hypothetical protein
LKLEAWGLSDEKMNSEIIKIWFLVALMVWAFPVLGIDDEEKSAIAAIKAGDIESLKSFLETHPGANCEFSNGKTGLYYAILYDAVPISEFLLKTGADPDFKIGDQSMLKWAIKNDRERITRLLIEYGADVNKPDSKQNTPLIYAAELNNRRLCKILIDRGADPSHKNQNGKRATDIAYNYGETSTYKYLVLIGELYEAQDSVPSLNDGPYVYYEDDERIVMNYYERVREENLTRIMEKTITTGSKDTIIEGFGWDRRSYSIKQKYEPDPDKLETTGSIFVIGDIHGKFNALVKLLMNNQIIDNEGNWSFGEGQLVLLGDVFDRGAFVTETLWFLHELEQQAINSGGKVHLLLGNHEIMALTGDHRYLHYKYDFFARYTRTDYYQLYEKNTVLGRWLRSQNIILTINGYLFMHAGISPEFASYDYSFSEINARLRNYLNSGLRDEDGSVEDIILGSIGPLWYRGYYNANNSDNTNDKYNDDGSIILPELTQEFVDNYLSSHGLKRMILGHNEQLSISTSYEGKVISADVALDDSGLSAQGLLISGDELFRCYADGRTGAD